VAGGRWQVSGGRSASVRVITIRWDADHSHSESHVAILKRMKHEDKNPTISILHEQALGIINVCKTPHQHCVDTRTIAIAQAIVAEARTALRTTRCWPQPFWRIPSPCGAPFSPPWK